MGAQLCCMQHSHVYQKMMRRSLLQTADSLNRRGKEQFTNKPTAQTVPELTCMRWSGG